MDNTNKLKLELGIWDSVKILLYQIFLGILINIIISIFLVRSDHILIGDLGSIIALIILIRKTEKKTQWSLRSSLNPKKENRGLILPLLITIIGMNITMSEAVNYLELLFPMSDFLIRLLNEAFGGDPSFISLFLSIAIIAPIVEEVIMRGLILNGLLRRYSRFHSIIISAFLFGIYHANIYQFVPAFISGLLFGWLYSKTKSLLLCIFGHSIYNSMIIILDGVLNLKIKGYTVDGFQPVWFTFTGIVLLLLGILNLKKNIYLSSNEAYE